MPSGNFVPLAVAAVMIGGIVVFFYNMMQPHEDGVTDGASFVAPQLSPAGARGETAFAANCASCHGVNALGSEKGPPLIHRYYEPGHHGDGAFRQAIRAGVRQHHWRFGDMPAQPQVSAAETEDIIRYVREIQAANGIGDSEHDM